MLKHLEINMPPRHGQPQKTELVPLTPSSANSSQPQKPSERWLLATKAVKRLFDLLPPPDVGDPEVFFASIIAVFAGFPNEVIEAAPAEIAKRSDRPTLKLVTAVCTELYKPIERQIERERAERSHLLSLPAPRQKRTPEEQARIEAKVAEVRALLGEPAPKTHHEPQPRHDGQHAKRIAADLAARKARNETQSA